MRLRTSLLSVAGLVVAIPATVLGVDTFVRWKPRLDSAVINRVDTTRDLDAYLRVREDSVADVKRAARKGIIWRDSVHKSKTPLAIVYLHGFSATRSEVSPVVEHLSDSLGANVFFTRLAAHGLANGEAFATVSPQQWIDDAREALAIGKKLGNQVVVVGTSTGALLAMQLASESHDSTSPTALVLISPNHEPADWRGRFVAGPFGPRLARLIGGDYHGFKPANAAQAELWTTRYRSEGVSALMDLVLYARTIDVSKIRIPVLTLYTHSDDVVRIDLIRSRHTEFGSRTKEIVDVPEATNHVLAGDAMGPRATDPVVNLMVRFIHATDVAGAPIRGGQD
jgi:esterase/lipase